MIDLIDSLKSKKKNIEFHYFYPALLFVVFLFVYFFFYGGAIKNYFFSDDFEWLSRGVLMQGSPMEMFKIHGRDFNPLFLLILGIFIKLFGLSPMAFRILSIVIAAGLTFTFSTLLRRHFNIDARIAFIVALSAGLNVFVSETVLNLAALVYPIAMLFFFIALLFYWDNKRWYFVLFLGAALLTKETVLLGIIPLFFYEKEKRNRLFIAITMGTMIIIRFLIQLGHTGKYTDFLDSSGFFYKLYFIMLRTVNLSPYSLSIWIGSGILILLVLGVVVLIRKDRRFLFWGLFYGAFVIFFAFLPKLSSRYCYYPTLGSWAIIGVASAFGISAFIKDSKVKGKQGFRPEFVWGLVLILILGGTNYVFIQGEIGDYRILGEYSKGFLQEMRSVVKMQSSGSEIGKTIATVVFYKGDVRGLADVYREISMRGNLPKLLPFRPHAIRGVLEPEHVVPLVCYPENILRWKPAKETEEFFTGQITK